MKNILLSGSAEEVGLKLQENYDRLLESTRRWAEMLAFDPDPRTGCSPRHTVWRKNKARLYRYISPHGYKHQTPILMVYALINKAYILDLIPGMSLVEYLVDEGFDVYLLDWGSFAWEDRDLSYGDLVFDYIARAVKKVCQTSDSPDLSILGYCMGGTMASMYAALFPRPRIRNLLLLAAPIDFTEAGISSIWLKTPHFDADRVADTFHLIPREFIDMGVKMLKPLNNYWGTYTRLWKSIDEGTPVEAWKALNKWVNDNVHFPGEAYRQWIKDLYQENQLVKDQFMIRGHLIKLSQIKSNLLVMAGEKDHLVLPHQTRAALKHMSSPDQTYHEYPIGHGGLVFGNYARKEVYPVISAWLAQR